MQIMKMPIEITDSQDTTSPTFGEVGHLRSSSLVGEAAADADEPLAWAMEVKFKFLFFVLYGEIRSNYNHPKQRSLTPFYAVILSVLDFKEPVTL